MRRIEKFYWESSPFLVVLNNLKCFGEETLESAKEIVRKVERREAVIITSQILVCEVLPSKSTPEEYATFEKWLSWENLHIRAVDYPVARKAAELRDECVRKGISVIKTPDALHIATAMLYEQEIVEMHSVDGDFSKTLERLGKSLKSTYPRLPQPSLPFKDE